ncbi:hypothetical protein TBR22_A29060 [Luteitalea sp. TBR-22]|uniref:hypothetical protein n=1 Tax=Luteitalea sp. TBR-22 TaxID=2802971 RepID=UPI001AF30CC4|nr:hypothetical protein [Luteitalea sp. TBR-22]BCS33679.1 hypothetical protein TBR22_A29060 [Luteitalea sp. TBR-22]
MTRLLDVLLGLLALFGLLSLAEGSLVAGSVSILVAGVGALVVPRGAGTANPAWGREAAHVADVIVDQVLFDHFGLSDAELEALAAVLPEPVRGPAPFWFLLHAGWLVREAARRRHGDAFVEQLRAAMRARLRLKGGNFDGPRWFATLDGAFTRADEAMRHPEEGDPPHTLRVARSLLGANAGSPYEGRLGVAADVDRQLATCLRALEEHLAPTIDALAGVATPGTATPAAEAASAVVVEAGPRERLLLHRDGNVLFAPERRVVTPDALAQARADDAQECEVLRQRAADVLAASASDAHGSDPTHCQARLDDLAALMAACARYGSAETLAIREQCRTAALDLVGAARHRPSSSPERDATWQGWLDSEETRFKRLPASSPADGIDAVPEEDVAAIVCSWTPDRIRDLAARLGIDGPEWQRLVPLCVERLLAAEQEGYPEERVAERLAALGRPRGVPMGQPDVTPA